MTCKDYQRVNSDIEADMDFKQWLNILYIRMTPIEEVEHKSLSSTDIKKVLGRDVEYWNTVNYLNTAIWINYYGKKKIT